MILPSIQCMSILTYMHNSKYTNQGDFDIPVNFAELGIMVSSADEWGVIYRRLAIILEIQYTGFIITVCSNFGLISKGICFLVYGAYSCWTQIASSPPGKSICDCSWPAFISCRVRDSFSNERQWHCIQFLILYFAINDWRDVTGTGGVMLTIVGVRVVDEEA